MTVEGSRLLAAAAWLPAGFWLAYALWNTILPAPPALGVLTPINAFYLAMLPAAMLSVVRWRRYAWPGRVPYALLVAWVIVGLAWFDAANGVDVTKRLLIYGLLGLTAAQTTVGGRRASTMFAGSLLLVALALSLWTIGHAVASGFSYRGGLPINPNLPATLIGPGLIAALALSLRRDPSYTTPIALGVFLTSLYGCLILGSRGVLAALVTAVAVVGWRMRPSVPRALVVAAGTAAVVVIAQMPAIPHALWSRALELAHQVQQGPATASTTASTTDAPATAPRAGDAPHLAPSPPPIATTATESTALARFREEGVGTFNLRSELWTACVRFLTSGVGAFLFGGGMGHSGAIAYAANPVFQSSHHAWLQMAVDFGLVGLALWVAVQWRIVRSLATADDWLAALGLATLVFWAVAGLTATVTNMHVYWVGLGAAAGSVSHLARPSSRETRPA